MAKKKTSKQKGRNNYKRVTKPTKKIVVPPEPELDGTAPPPDDAPSKKATKAKKPKASKASKAKASKAAASKTSKPKRSTAKKPTVKKTTTKKIMGGGPSATHATDHREANRRSRRGARKRQNDIAYKDDVEYPWWESIDWERRLACSQSLKLHCEEYHSTVFYLGWSSDQLECIKQIETVFREEGVMFTLAMPRGSGKTALCRAGMTWGTGNAYRRFPFFVGSTDPKTHQTLDAVKVNWYRNPKLKEDYPEICWPIERIENRYQLAASQEYLGHGTALEWSKSELRYPSMLLPKEIAEVYLQNVGPSGLFHLPGANEPWHWQDNEYEGPVSSDTDLREDRRYLVASAGLTIGTAGIGGSIRGEAETHPYTLEQPRPDALLLDDVQKDAVAESPTSVNKVIRLIDGAIIGLSKPGEHIAALQPCTVIMEGDAADHYLEHEDWASMRCKMVTSWPEGITDFEITQDTPASNHWLHYAELRRVGVKREGHFRKATAYYKQHRKVMDKDFVVSWEDRYTKKIDQETGESIELSAQQHAMNLRLKSPKTFLSEFQNIGKSLIEEGEILITAEQLCVRHINLPRLQVPHDCVHSAAFIDVQNEIMFYGVLSTDLNFNGVFCDYGWYPEPPRPYFTKQNCNSWSLLSRAFFKEHPSLRTKATYTGRGHIRAPFEAKIYWALQQIVKLVKTRVPTRTIGVKQRNADQPAMQQVEVPIERIGVDTRWGQAADIVKRFIRENNSGNLLMPYYGQSFPPSHRQLEEYNRQQGWMFEQDVNPEVTEPRWVIRPNPDGMFYTASDVDRGKDFLFQRLGTPVGGQGALVMFEHEGGEEGHALIADHVCKSEYPEPRKERLIEKNMWKERENAFDNDFLDIFVGCVQMVSQLGVSLKTPAGAVKVSKRSLGGAAKSKQEGRR